MPDVEAELDRAAALRVYEWRLREYAQSPGYQRIVREIALSRAKLFEDSCWDKFLWCLALVETFERRLWLRGAERIAYYVSMRTAQMTLGPFQVQGAPLNISDTVKLVISKLGEAGIDSSFCDENLTRLARHWYGHAAIEPGAVCSYSDAMRCAEQVIADLS